MRKRKPYLGPMQEYSYERLKREREYGLFWYDWLWALVRPLLIGLCSLTLVIGIGISVWGLLRDRYFAPADRNDSAEVLFEVESGNSLTRVANNLEAVGLVRNRSVFKYYADFLGYGQKIQAGTYTLRKTMTLREIAEQLTRGDGTPLVRNITVIEGWNVRDIAAYLLREGIIENEESFLALCRTGTDFAAYYYIADVLKTSTAGQRLYALEGYFAPDTYEIYTSATASDIIRKLLSQTEAVFKDEWHTRAEEIGLTMDEVITLASLIEKEAKSNDFARVSAVFHNRLNSGMLLGSDVTIKYVTGTRRMRLNDSDLQVDSPYNTYKHHGLPVGPICNPSAAAIEAALYPDMNFVAEKYLFFCSKDPDTGELYFSRTLAEHEAAVSIYAPLWQAYDERTGAK